MLKQAALVTGAIGAVAVLAFFFNARAGAPDAAPAAGRPALAEGAGPQNAAAAGEARDEPAPGEVALRVENGGVWLRAERAHRRVVLARLAHAGRFEVFDYTADDPLVSVRLEATTWHAAIDAVIQDAPYAIRFAAQSAAGEDRIHALDVGVPPALARARNDRDRVVGRGADDDEEMAARERERLAKGEMPSGEIRWQAREYTPAQQAAWRAGAQARQARRHAQVIQELGSGSAEDREFAVFSLDPSDPSAVPHLEAALLDVDSAVRTEAARQFALADPRAALPALTRALSDSSPGVVVAAIEGLASLEDPAALSSLRRLASHSNPDVRDAAEQALRN